MCLPDRFDSNQWEYPPSLPSAIDDSSFKTESFIPCHIGPNQDEENNGKKKKEFNAIIKGKVNSGFSIRILWARNTLDCHRLASGLKSTPDSFLWASVIGVGAPVSGSPPLAVLGKAITSRIDSAPARSAQRRSRPSAIPP